MILYNYKALLQTENKVRQVRMSLYKTTPSWKQGETGKDKTVQASPTNWKQGETGKDETVQTSPTNWKQGETGKDKTVQASPTNWKQGETSKDEPVQASPTNWKSPLPCCDWRFNVRAAAFAGLQCITPDHSLCYYASYHLGLGGVTTRCHHCYIEMIRAGQLCGDYLPLW